GDYLSDPDPVKAGRVMDAMMQMKKIEVAKLKAAYEGK
ncbi:MAG: VOC family protein, partial [Proteobacteria bacterium]